MFDFLVVLTLEAVVGADLADPNIDHIHTGVEGKLYKEVLDQLQPSEDWFY